MKYPVIQKNFDITLTQVSLNPGEFIAVYGGEPYRMQIEILVRKDGRVGIFFDEHADVLGYEEQWSWIEESEDEPAEDDPTPSPWDGDETAATEVQ